MDASSLATCDPSTSLVSRRRSLVDRLRSGRATMAHDVPPWPHMAALCSPSPPALWLRGVPANLILQDTIERIYVGKEYGDIERGIYLIRGENVVLLGEVVSAAPLCCAPCAHPGYMNLAAVRAATPLTMAVCVWWLTRNACGRGVA